jgi:hypothetical protein
MANGLDGVAKTLRRKSFMHYEALIFGLLFYQEKSKSIKLKKLYFLSFLCAQMKQKVKQNS